MIIWDEIIVDVFNWEKNLFWTNKLFVYLIFINKLLWYRPKIMYENIIQKDMNKFKESLNMYNVDISSTTYLPTSSCLRS